MSSSKHALLLSLPLFLSTGCNAAFWGNLGVLCITVGIFLGTVFMSRGEARTQPRDGAETTSSR